MKLTFRRAEDIDASALSSIKNAAADALTKKYGHGHWSHGSTEAGVLRGFKQAYVLVAEVDGELAGMLRLVTKKPWAIDPTFFTAVTRPLYLVDMVIAPHRQKLGIGRSMLVEAATIAKGWPANAIWLDAYHTSAGAGQFYERCGFREVGRKTYRGTPLVYFEQLL